MSFSDGIVEVDSVEVLTDAAHDYAAESTAESMAVNIRSTLRASTAVRGEFVITAPGVALATVFRAGMVLAYESHLRSGCPASLGPFEEIVSLGFLKNTTGCGRFKFRRTEGGLDKGLANLWSGKKIAKKAHAGRGQEPI